MLALFPIVFSSSSFSSPPPLSLSLPCYPCLFNLFLPFLCTETPSSPVHHSNPALAKALSEETPLNNLDREESELGSEEEEEEEDDDDREGGGRRPRLCQRVHRLESLSSRLGRQVCFCP